MAQFEIIWTTRAKIDFDENIVYLLENWTEREALKFTRKALILKPISLYYRINQNTIELLRFWGNRMNPEEIESSL